MSTLQGERSGEECVDCGKGRYSGVGACIGRGRIEEGTQRSAGTSDRSPKHSVGGDRVVTDTSRVEILL